MADVIGAIRTEYTRYRRLAEGAIAQVDDGMLLRPLGDASIAMYLTHVGGNLASRFRDFLDADGEKPDRDRDREFDFGLITGDSARTLWQQGWTVLEAALAQLTPADLERSVRIRGQALTVPEALQRSVAHTAYHVGQIVLLAKIHLGERWRALSIPRGGSMDYNRHPTKQRPPG